ncbi:P-loop NTPase fold protein [Photobacterium leiognathi]|uniref:P-loop NTPase fold protein n=1 Tax=Photobacterium leiognathi TaxID=553611 RepID=UPI0029827CCE|nr:P-loop NTPase fold protein [Photobacterium leiognathi]
MLEKNNNINDFLDYYFRFEHAPEYAVMIKGAWGSGKSWFVKKALERLEQNSGKYLYVSLYGIVCFEDIENSFFEQMHPVLSSKGMKLTSKIAKGLLKATIKLDLDGDGKSETTAKIPTEELKLPEYLKDTDSFVLVFDDLERCSMNISDVLGYINQFVEHQGYKVLIIANEDEILDKSDEDKCYSRAKEKLIGKTFELVPNTSLALGSFIESSYSESLEAFYQDNLSNIISVYSSSECKNLRHLKQALWDFERFYNALPSSTFDKVELKSELLNIFLCFAFETRSANYSIQTIARVKDSIYEDMFNEGDDKPKSLYSVLSSKYPMINFSDSLVEESVWVDFFDKGIIDEGKIKESIERNKYYQDINTENWVKLWHYHNLSDSEFERLYDAVNKEITEYKYREHQVVKHLAGLFIRLSDIALIPINKITALNTFKSYVDYLYDNDHLPSELNDHRFDFDTDSWGGLGFAGRDIQEFEQFEEYLNERTEQYKVKCMPNIADELLELMKHDVELFTLKLILCNREENIYYKTPILKDIDSSQFVEALLSLPGEKFRRVGYMFKERYSVKQFHVHLINELDWLKDVESLLGQKQRESKGKLSGYRISLLVDSYIKPAIDSLEKDN